MSIADAVARASAYLTEHPDEARRAVDHCPVSETIARAVPVALEVR